jgi:hypothetical protein
MISDGNSIIDMINEYMVTNNKTIEEVVDDVNFIKSICDTHQNLTFDQCADIDEYFFGDCGTFWRRAFRYPQIGQIVMVPVMDPNPFTILSSDGDYLMPLPVTKSFIFTIQVN